MRLHHVGIAVTDIDAAVKLYTGVLGAQVRRRGSFEELEFALLDSGGSELELLCAHDAGSAIGKFVAERGPGLHHLAYAVTDLPRELERLLAAGLQQSGEVRRGIHGTPIVFLHPKSAAGVLTELVQDGL
ncbi:MAG TPA: VOC family protein [Candidatus Acidoferrales bacterium]|nr:VOC family protein [Candidatus Acidoferrales bacterium]